MVSNECNYDMYNKASFSSIMEQINKVNNGTYARRKIIEAIEKRLGSRVIVYTAEFDNPMSGINRKDIIPYEEMLSSIGNVDTISLIMHSMGGDFNTAEKIIKMTRNYCKTFKFIVPNVAKSAATLIGLGSDEIMMGYLSELGPIDPQVTYKLPNGQWSMSSGQSIIDSFKKIKSEIDGLGRLSKADMHILNNFDITLVDYAEKESLRSRQLAQKLLETYMLKEDKDKAKSISEYLADANKHLSHNKIIDREEAEELGLKITYINKEDSLWKLIWELHCRTIVTLKDSKAVKIFETATNMVAQNGLTNSMQ